jgi:hypothetical protein
LYYCSNFTLEHANFISILSVSQSILIYLLKMNILHIFVKQLQINNIDCETDNILMKFACSSVKFEQ